MLSNSKNTTKRSIRQGKVRTITIYRSEIIFSSGVGGYIVVVLHTSIIGIVAYTFLKVCEHFLPVSVKHLKNAHKTGSFFLPHGVVFKE